MNATPHAEHPSQSVLLIKLVSTAITHTDVAHPTKAEMKHTLAEDFHTHSEKTIAGNCYRMNSIVKEV